MPCTQELTGEDDGGLGARGLIAATSDILDRVLLARLVTEPPEGFPQPPLAYMLACYGRCDDRRRASSAMAPVTTIVKDALMNYAGLLLFAGVVPQVGVRRRKGDRAGPVAGGAWLHGARPGGLAMALMRCGAMGPLSGPAGPAPHRTGWRQ